MTFFYYEINTRRFIQSTNIRALEEFSGISYHKIWNWFTDGSNLHADDSIICGCSDLVRGKQRLSWVQKQEKKLGEQMVKEQVDVILSGSRSDLTGPSGEQMKLPKRQTKQPDNRNMKQYDDFFKEVE